VVGRARTYVNGEACERATLRPGDTVLLRGELLLLCVQRPKELARPRTERPLHAYGEADEAGIVGEGPAIWQLRKNVAFAAEMHGDHVLVGGESGAGKELTAGAVHKLSERARGPFVSRNASTFSPALIAAELFGNPANYPNPGTPARKGLFGEAHGGTLFLDEIGECPREVQAQLLRVMDEGEYQAVGEATVRHSDARVIGATNRDESAFREDFLARFALRVRVPPLRERREDIPLLIRHFLRQRAEQFPEVGKRFLTKGPDGWLHPKISSRFVDHLLRHPLHRNIRELHGILLRAIEISQGDVLMMPEEVSKRPPLPPPSPEMPDSPAGTCPPPKEEVVACLNRERWNIARAARMLGIGRRSLYRLMEAYGIAREPIE
jgi:DNA-binding NtrC family response regulator